MDKEIICGIYKITSPTNKIYIGESKDIYDRWYYYKVLDCKGQSILYKSFKKYGVENHIFEIIEECDFDELLCRERYWQDFYDVLNGGLNCVLTQCGEQKRVLSEESVEKIKLANIGKIVSTKTREKQRQNNIGLKHPEWRNEVKSKAQGGKNHWNYGNTTPKETLDKKSKSMKEFYKANPHPSSKSILQYDLNMNFIREWESALEVYNKLGFGRQAIQNCALGKSKTSNNYIWRYKEVKNKTFYRVCNENTQQGLWYDFSGKFTGLIHNDFKFCQNNSLEMEFDEELVGWLSAVEKLDDLWQWFSQEDIKQLQKHGWYIFEYKAKDYKFYERFQHLVIKQDTSKVIRKIEL